MKTLNKVYLSALGIVCALGSSKEEVFQNLVNGNNSSFVDRVDFSSEKIFKVASPEAVLPEIPTSLSAYNTRCNRLLLQAYNQIENQVQNAIHKYGKTRIAVIIGSCTSGIDEGQRAIQNYLEENDYPPDFDYRFLEMASPSEFLAKYIGLQNIFYTISTACSSSAKVFSSAKNLINLGICDAVLVGGSDSLCKLTVNGFSSLQAVTETICNPFSKNRSGITLGEGAALFLMTKDQSNIALLGSGESSDAYHTTAPDPDGNGAYLAMQLALQDAKLTAEDIDYLNLHGTGTEANDLMESRAVHKVFKDKVACSSTKPLTGHTLGSAGAIELGLCWLLLSELNKSNYLAPHLWDEQFDDELSPLNLVNKSQNHNSHKVSTCMSNSFAFGGSNISLILGAQN